jgi:hypothetical protein
MGVNLVHSLTSQLSVALHIYLTLRFAFMPSMYNAGCYYNEWPLMPDHHTTNSCPSKNNQDSHSQQTKQNRKANT